MKMWRENQIKDGCNLDTTTERGATDIKILAKLEKGKKKGGRLSYLNDNYRKKMGKKKRGEKNFRRISVAGRLQIVQQKYSENRLNTGYPYTHECYLAWTVPVRNFAEPGEL